MPYASTRLLHTLPLPSPLGRGNLGYPMLQLALGAFRPIVASFKCLPHTRAMGRWDVIVVDLSVKHGVKRFLVKLVVNWMDYGNTLPPSPSPSPSPSPTM